MRKIFRFSVLLIVLFGLQSVASARKTITTEQAAKFIGQQKTVCGTVASAHYAFLRRGKPSFLNLDKPYPNQIFTAVIWGSAKDKFRKPPDILYSGKEICVTGLIRSFRGQPEIVVGEPSQIKANDAKIEDHSGRWVFLKRLPQLNLYVDSHYVNARGQYVSRHRDKDFFITVLEDYSTPSTSQGAKSSECNYLLDSRKGIYVLIDGFDYQEHMGKGRAMHFESSQSLGGTLSDKSTWDRASSDNVGGPMINFVEKRLRAGNHRPDEHPTPTGNYIK